MGWVAPPPAIPPAHETCTLAFGTTSGIAPLTLCVLPPRAHSESNASCAHSESAGDATGTYICASIFAQSLTRCTAGLRSSGGASRALCFLLHKNPSLLLGANVLELGCGAAAAGLFSARSATTVVLTDGDDASLLLARASLAANADTTASDVRFAPLAWGTAGSRAAAPLGGPSLADVLFAGAAPSALPLLVLASDLLYYRAGSEALVVTLSELLLRTGGLCLCAFSPRHPDWRSVLCGAAAANGLEVWRLPLSSFVPGDSLAEGWFASTRMVLIWHSAAPPPTLADGDSERLRRLHATAAAKEAGKLWGELAGRSSGSSGSDSG